MLKTQSLRVYKELTPKSFIRMLIDAAVIIASLFVITLASGYQITPKYYVVALIIFALTFPGTWFKANSLWANMVEVLGRWFVNMAILLFFGYATDYLDIFPREVMLTWFWLAPLMLVITHFVAAKLFASQLFSSTVERTAVIVGVSELGAQLRDKMHADAELHLTFNGFFDDRHYDRLKPYQLQRSELLGSFSMLADYVKEHAIETIFIALPNTSEPRLISLIDSLKDTTTSIYFVPNVFMFDLIQARISDVAGIPVIAVCETPFSGMSGFVKRASDVVFSLFIILMLLPIYLLISLGIELSSSGPILFRQRRYGLDGQEIVVYKFRTMTVLEDDNEVVQAIKNDSRVTTFGSFLRKTSLDEIPQFFNVLQGTMSIVGPRPHAVSHNELYRKAIKGYMVRHKVKPGITGWAQVNGLRGQTETLEKMKKRVEYDLDYLRHWTLFLDIKIIIKTAFNILFDKTAY